MRQILFIILISSILLPLAASQQGLTSFDKVASAAANQATKYSHIVNRWLWSE